MFLELVRGYLFKQMYNNQSSKQDLLNNQDLMLKAFQLAFFIHPNKDMALEITENAFEMWDVICERQDKRRYYNLKGRLLANQEKKKQRVKVNVHEEQLLQRLIYKLSEDYELTPIWSKNTDEEGLLICYLKRLLSMVLKHNSFSTAVGISRVLHKYSNRETVELYMLLAPNRTTQDIANIERESKRCKSKLISQLKEFFGEFISISKNEKEERFETVKDPHKLLLLFDLVEDCLERFKPWVTECMNSLNDFVFTNDDPDNEYPIELKRIHSLIHYNCYRQLTAALSLAPPKDRLEIPLFSLMENSNDKNSKNRRNPPDVTAELSMIPQKLNEISKRRKNALAGILSIVIDGKEKAVFNPLTEKHKNLQLSEDTELIEIRSKEDGLLLMTHLITEETFGKQQKPQNYAIKLEGGQVIDLSISFLENNQSDEEISLDIRYKETYLPRVLIFIWNKWIYKINAFFGSYLAFRPQTAIIIMFFTLIIVSSYLYFRSTITLPTKQPIITKEEVKPPTPTPVKDLPFNIPNLKPDATPSPKPDKLAKQNPLNKVPKQNLKANVPVVPPDFTERGKETTKELFSIKKIYIKLQDQQLQQDIETFIAKNSTIKVANLIIQADTVLQYSEEKKAIFLINKTGDILWQRKISKDNFTKDNLINIVDELLREIENAKNQ